MCLLFSFVTLAHSTGLQFLIYLFQSLLDEPNPNSPANSLAAQLYQENKREYEKRVATVVEQSWLNFQESHTEDPR